MNRREHLLTILAEEAVEVAQRADKALRFGLSETQPGQEWTNVGRLGRELADLQAAVEMLAAEEPWIANVLLVVTTVLAAVPTGLAMLGQMAPYQIALIALGAFALSGYGVNAWTRRKAISMTPTPAVAEPAAIAIATPASSGTDDPRRARLQIQGVILVVRHNEGELRYELKNTGGMQATGIVHQTWIETEPELPRPEPASPRMEGEREFLAAEEVLTIERSLTEPYVDPTFHLYAHFGGGEVPPLVSPDQLVWLQNYPLVLGIRVVYWDGDHTRRIAESRHSYNPVNGATGWLYYQEDTRLDSLKSEVPP